MPTASSAMESVSAVGFPRSTADLRQYHRERREREEREERRERRRRDFFEDRRERRDYYWR
jgi:hypothetical protein